MPDLKCLGPICTANGDIRAIMVTVSSCVLVVRAVTAQGRIAYK